MVLGLCVLVHMPPALSVRDRFGQAMLTGLTHGWMSSLPADVPREGHVRVFRQTMVCDGAQSHMDFWNHDCDFSQSQRA